MTDYEAYPVAMWVLTVGPLAALIMMSAFVLFAVTPRKRKNR